MTEDNDRLTIEVPPPSYNLYFQNETGTIGTLDWSSGKLVFEGNADESAKIFFEYLKTYIDSYIDQEIKRSVK